MSHVTVTKQTIDISGMGGGYEDMCQRMLWRGVAHLAESQPPVGMWEQATQYRGITGIMTTDGAHLKALEAAMIHPDDDVTGAMHQAVMNHLAWIHRHGVEGWLREAERRDPSRLRTWTGEL
jgi:hypothetical protein